MKRKIKIFKMKARTNLIYLSASLKDENGERVESSSMRATQNWTNIDQEQDGGGMRYRVAIRKWEEWDDYKGDESSILHIYFIPHNMRYTSFVKPSFV